MSWRKSASVSKQTLLKLLYNKPPHMTIQERVQELFNRFNVNLQVERVDMAEAVLENGTVIYTDADSFEEGAEAYIINDEGERIVLPEGDYDLADGTKVSVGEGGKINAVVKPEGKAGDKGDRKGGDGKGVNPKGVTKPENEGGNGGGGGGAPDQQPAPPKGKQPPAKKKKSSQKPNNMDTQKDEFVDSPLTREMVEEMIQKAIAAMMGDEEKEEDMAYGDKDKEEMSAVNPEAASEAQAEAEAAPAKEPKASKKDDAKEELSAVKAELDALRTELAETKKAAASRGVQRQAPTKRPEPLNLKNMTTEERVRALANQFSK